MSDIVVLNDIELSEITGRPTATQADRETAAQGLVENPKTQTVIVTLGAKGCMVKGRDSVNYFSALKVDAVDTTAAGDAFVAGLAVALAEGKGLEEAVRQGNAAGGLAATKLGAQPSLPTRQALERLLAEGDLRSTQGDKP